MGGWPWVAVGGWVQSQYRYSNKQEGPEGQILGPQLSSTLYLHFC